MQRTINLILSATLALACTSVMAEGRPTRSRPAAPPATAETVNQHEHHDHGPAQATATAGKPADTTADSAKRQGRDWTKYPLIVPVMRMGERERMSTGLIAKNIETDSFEVFAPDSRAKDARRPVAATPEGAAIKALPKLGNYYWVTAREVKNDQVTVASTPYYFGEPGPAPTKLLLEQKNELEIIPQPLPREHGAWRESEKWEFLLRFNGQPLANRAVRMETEFGTKTTFVSNENGLVTVLFPRDFKPAEKKSEQGSHSHGPRRAKFVLTAEHDDSGKHYLTAFNYTYSADADRGKNLLAGVGFGLFGMLLATPLLRRKNTENNKNTKEA